MIIPTPNDDLIDSRDVVEAVEELQSEKEAYPDEFEDQDTLDELEEFLQEIRDYAGESPEDGVTVIRGSYFVTYAMELAEDIGAVGNDFEWPLGYIDWEAAADALQNDYSSVEFAEVEYWVRA